jgi:hypothetical protein
MMAPDVKLVPLMVRVNAGPPAVALEGESEEIVGTGRGGGVVEPDPLQAEMPDKITAMQKIEKK